MVFGVPCICINTHKHPNSATTSRISASWRSALISFIIAAPICRARRATAALQVSTETGIPVERAASHAGMARRSSSSKETGEASGREDSAPISTISAPSSIIRRIRVRISASSR